MFCNIWPWLANDLTQWANLPRGMLICLGLENFLLIVDFSSSAVGRTTDQYALNNVNTC